MKNKKRNLISRILTIGSIIAFIVIQCQYVNQSEKSLLMDFNEDGIIDSLDIYNFNDSLKQTLYGSWVLRKYETDSILILWKIDALGIEEREFIISKDTCYVQIESEYRRASAECSPHDIKVSEKYILESICNQETKYSYERNDSLLRLYCINCKNFVDPNEFKLLDTVVIGLVELQPQEIDSSRYRYVFELVSDDYTCSRIR